MNLDELTTKRHKAFLAARDVDFKPCPVTTAWRKANRAYVIARAALLGSKSRSKQGKDATMAEIRVPASVQQEAFL
jgi:hypothetical protein